MDIREELEQIMRVLGKPPRSLRQYRDIVVYREAQHLPATNTRSPKALKKVPKQEAEEKDPKANYQCVGGHRTNAHKVKATHQRGLKHSGKDVIVRRPLCSDASSSEDNSDMEFDSDDADGENDAEPVPPSAAFLRCAIPCILAYSGALRGLPSLC